MKFNRFTSIGGIAIAAVVTVTGIVYATSGVAHAGNACDATATATSAPVGQIQALQVAPTCTPVATNTATTTGTAVVFKTHTPTSTSTALPSTNTPVPEPTKPAATNTPKPTGGNEGANVKPPNTGSGGDAGSDNALPIWLLALGVASAALGGGALLTGLRQRR